MKITTDLLRKIKACNKAVNKFNNTTELHDIDITTINEITVGDSCEYISGHYIFSHKGNCKNPIHYQNKVTVIDTVEYQLVHK